jgi:RNA polymerase sigma factor (sigma-70 family)
MPNPSLHTAQLHLWLERMRGGDQAARDELLRSVGNRLERLARKMLGKFPHVRRYIETGDVLNTAVMRLLRALETVQPPSVRDFFGLAAEQMRRELLDLARRFYGKHGIGANHDSMGPESDVPAPAADPPVPADDPDELDDWRAFHEEVERLPVEEREVVGLIFYHDWKQAQVAELLGINERTVRRYWRSAMTKLRRALRDDAA